MKLINVLLKASLSLLKVSGPTSLLINHLHTGACHQHSSDVHHLAVCCWLGFFFFLRKGMTVAKVLPCHIGEKYNCGPFPGQSDSERCCNLVNECKILSVKPN